ncbi:MAG: DUF1156 domain-containing protein [Planctomycetaceae bacterium]
MIESNFDIAFAAGLAVREKQIQQNYRPIIAVHKWFARRPGTLFRSLLLSEFVDQPLAETYYRPHELHGRTIADPFMGGGTPILEANRLGCDVRGFDINPMAYWIVQEEIESIDLAAYRMAAHGLRSGLEKEIGESYRTDCTRCGKPASVKYFLWVKTLPCPDCGETADLFPGYLLAEDVRHPRNVLVCADCGELNEVASLTKPGKCTECGSVLSTAGASRGRARCRTGHEVRYPSPENGVPAHRMFAIEYHCETCKSSGHKGRLFKRPDKRDADRFRAAEARLSRLRARFIPDDEIPEGDETTRLHKWGYRRFSELHNARQLLSLELSCRAIARQKDERIRHALATNLSDLLRYQNVLCRYDTMALKSLDVFSIHGFPVGLIYCESNALGISGNGSGSNVGSGGWSNVIEKYAKAKLYCEQPFEIRHDRGRKTVVPITGEWIGEHRTDSFMGTNSTESRQVDLRCQSATVAKLRPNQLDGVFTDPPYFGNVQYAELMDFCFHWLRRLVDRPEFKGKTTRNADELTANSTMGRGIEHFTEGLSEVFQRLAGALKPGAPFVFTYHHNRLDAYAPLAVALLDSGLCCTAALPCPAEMAASIHIKGTGSSIIDTVFVSRARRTVRDTSSCAELSDLDPVLDSDVESLRAAGVKVSRGDVRCILFGHVVRTAISQLHRKWNRTALAGDKVASVIDWLGTFAPPEQIEGMIDSRAQNATVSV